MLHVFISHIGLSYQSYYTLTQRWHNIKDLMSRRCRRIMLRVHVCVDAGTSNHLPDVIFISSCLEILLPLLLGEPLVMETRLQAHAHAVFTSLRHVTCVIDNLCSLPAPLCKWLRLVLEQMDVTARITRAPQARSNWRGSPPSPLITSQPRSGYARERASERASRASHWRRHPGGNGAAGVRPSANKHTHSIFSGNKSHYGTVWSPRLSCWNPEKSLFDNSYLAFACTLTPGVNHLKSAFNSNIPFKFPTLFSDTHLITFFFFAPAN